MEKRIEKIIKEKEYVKLNTEELLLIQDWVEDEDAFYAMKDLLNQTAAAFMDLRPSSGLKKNLMEEFKTAYPPEKENRKMLYTMLSAAAVVLLALLLYYPSDDAVRAEKSIGPLAEDKGAEQNQPMPLVETDPPKQEAQVPSNQKELTPGIVEKADKLAKNEVVEEEAAPIALKKSSPSSVFAKTNTHAWQMDEPKPESFSLENRMSGFIEHKDFISNMDLPANKKEFIQNNPNVIDFLYTAY